MTRPEIDVKRGAHKPLTVRLAQTLARSFSRSSTMVCLLQGILLD